MTDPVNRPAHYTRLSPEPIDVIASWKLDFLRGNVVKYIARAGHKGDELEDLRKARAYLDRAIEACNAHLDGEPPTVQLSGVEQESVFPTLTKREREVAVSLVSGMTCREIANLLGTSTKTVDTQRSLILKKLELRNTVELTLYALRHGYFVNAALAEPPSTVEQGLAELRDAEVIEQPPRHWLAQVEAKESR